MGFEPGGMSEKLGNRYEGRWVAKQLLRLLNEEIKSVTVELIGPDERGVDLLVVKKDGVRQLQQCKARFESRESWTVNGLNSRGILGHLLTHLSRNPLYEFALVSAIPAQTIADICESARNSNDNPKDFFTYQIKNVGAGRHKIFNDFCRALKLDPDNEKNLREAFSYLRRTYIELYPDDHNTWSELLTLAGFLLTGKSKTAISVLLTYAENNDRYHNPIYANELREYLAKDHNIHPKKLEHDTRIGPAIEELQNRFSDSIRPLLIGSRVIPREETSRTIECIDTGQDVVLHGAMGFGKSGVLYELTEYLSQHNIPYLPVRLDRRIPDKTAALFGKDLGLPESPASSLAGLAVERRSVLILDQLDAIRWTAAHSSVAMDVCKEMVRQVRLLRRMGKKIVVVFACRSFDLDNDPEIKNLLADTKNQSFVKIQVQELSDEQLKKIVGRDFSAMTGSQKRILASPLNLAIWMQLKKDGTKPNFNSATELMRRFWENRRRVLEKEVKISAGQMDEFLRPVLNYMETKGEISAPVSITPNNPLIQDALISYGILQKSPGRISFCHQRYLDHLIAERVVRQIFKGAGTVTSWLGPKENQSLFRREQLRQALVMLADESPSDFLSNGRELLESDEVRFHLKHLVLELIGQLDEISEEIAKYCLILLEDNYWQGHILETVFWRNHSWVSYLLKTGIISSWLFSQEEQEVNRALWLLRSVAEHIPDQVAEMLIPLVDRGGNWLGRVLNTICWNEADDSEQMFELRLRLLRRGQVKGNVFWPALCIKYPIRAIQFIEAVISAWEIDGADGENSQKDPLERWGDTDIEALKSVAKKYPAQTWDLLIGHIERLTSIRIDNYDSRFNKWINSYYYEPGIARGMVDLVILAGQTLATDNPDELSARTNKLEDSISPVVQRIIIEVYAHLPAAYANTGIEWLLNDQVRFLLGFGGNEPKWRPAIHLIKALSPHCSEELFQRLEEAIVHYHSPGEKDNAKSCLEGSHRGHFGHYWGKAQYFLLPALDAKRIQPNTADLIHVLQRKFADHIIEKGATSGGMVGSTLDPNLEKISDQAWLHIIASDDIPENDNTKWIQIDPERVLESTITQFANSLSLIAGRFPERFGQLALRFPNNAHPKYISAILKSFSKKQPSPELTENERISWRPTRVETIEAVLDKYHTVDDQDIPMAFCQLIVERAEENWSDKTISRLVHYAKNHPDLEIGKLNFACDTSSDDASVKILFQNTINCVRGVAAGAIGQLLWLHKDLLRVLRPGIESLIHDIHPAVRMAAIEAIEPVLNIDKDLAVQWFCEACKDDLRVAASPRASRFFNSIVPSHIDQVKPIIQQMAASPLDDVAYEGARQVTARWLFYGYFKDEVTECRNGTVPQRKGVAEVAADHLHNTKYSSKCQELLRHLINDPDKDVRDEVRGMFRRNDFLTEPEYISFLKDYIRSKTFADAPINFIWDLEKFSGSLVPVAEAIFTVCEELSTTLVEKTRNIGLQHSHTASEISSVLLRLYEQAQGTRNKQIANRCLDIWDLFFENRVGRVIELTSAIEK